MTATRVLLVHPRFNPGSFWNYSRTCELVGAKYPAPPLGLITVAAMLPADWEIRLVDRNTSELADADIAWADMVMTGGMLPQQFDTLHVIHRAQSLGRPVVVGGPDPTSSPQVYERADFRVLGEVEGIMPDFIAAWRAGERRGTFTAERFKADITTTPVPRYDLLRLSDYTNLSLQFSRGCPFTCEFCDIIELYGRVPRTKTTPQVLAELEALRVRGYRGHVDFVDDNLVGNKKALKAFLPELIAWQKRHDYPFEFSTEASINLADDAELLDLLRQANFFLIFIGIESPNPETLRLMQKKQNTRRSIPDSVRRVQGAGIIVIGGFIVGFDDETAGVGKGIVQLIEDAAIPVAMAGLLYALPDTQLSRRLTREGRLHPGGEVVNSKGLLGDQCTSGLNFDTRRPRQEVLADYREVVARAYTPQAFFGRLLRAGLNLGMKPPAGRIALRDLPRDGLRFARVALALTRAGGAERRAFWGMVATLLRRNPRALKTAITVAALYTHLGPFSRHVLETIDRQIEEVASGRWQPPVPVPVLPAEPEAVP
ncbi:B12-binding domain-containing radical SAM protein [Falsiroseomonas bella]|uniref:B12-binding domain-containing radical SAM protein n=1 Tax=Falsiroseomonas bella TaxID=2184016 RepID=A0A317F9E2_9PROT|nr:B12-binding domain-containing radical SAM protein [Falsiroseomonas bella]PWS35375.1 B12-binding domain-containing radical SAM protein [Falsiroseomonas bella]